MRSRHSSVCPASALSRGEDLYVVRAIAARAAIDTAPYTFVFSGGTALARAHKLGRGMSEDVDFKIVQRLAAPVSRSILRQQLGALRDRMTDALHAAGFVFDPHNPDRLKSRNESLYTVYELPYEASGAGEGLRPAIQAEPTYASLRQQPVVLTVSSFVAQAQGRPPEVPIIACMSIVETAAEKRVSLTRRTAMDLACLSRGESDVALVRHIYDRHQMRELIEHGKVARLARDIAAADADHFRNQYPAYHADIAGETHKALNVSGDRVNPSTGATRNPSTLRSRERQIAGSIERISAWQGRAETVDEDAGRGGGDAAASRVGLGHPSDRDADWLQPGDGSAVSGCRWLDAVPGSNPTEPADGPFNLAG